MAVAAPVLVTNCFDSGAGSLRAAVASAASGDTVDMSGLTTSSLGCGASVISLHTGDIGIAVADLTIKGPGMDKMLVTGQYNGGVEHHRIFTHVGTGTLVLENFSIAYGYSDSSTPNPSGGCVSSAGSVELDSVRATNCTVSGSSRVQGGAIYAAQKATLRSSIVSYNAARTVNELAYGGGVSAKHGLSAYDTTIAHNSAGSPNSVGQGGGMAARGDLYLRGSTVSGNYSSYFAGGLLQLFGAVTLVNSTIADNVSARYVGGAMLGGDPSVKIYNSTIAFNTTAHSSPNYAGGLTVQNNYGTLTITLQSALIAKNSDSNGANDVTGRSIAIAGSHNLIRVSSVAVPNDTITGTCPLLGRLRSNGGLTQTIALQSQSPGIDQGNNIFAGGLAEDQRGRVGDVPPYAYVRESGNGADIGAHEMQQDDALFSANMEGCN